MIRGYPHSRWILCIFFPLVLTISMLLGDSLSRQESCGKKIYFHGVDCEGHEIKALLGDTEISAKVQPCSSCHGADGKGRPESGLDPGDITWEHLSVAYGHSHDTGREHPAFTGQSLYRAVTQGIDPANHQLSTLMPRFRLSRQQFADLFAFVKRISNDFDPGLEPSSIKVGSLLPEKGSKAEAGNAVRSVLAAYFEEVNQRGGIYGRRIILQFGEATGSKAETIHNATRLVGAPVFALIAPFTPGAEKEVAALAHENNLPVLAPLTLSVPDDPGTSEVFYLSPGLQQLEVELIHWAAGQSNAGLSRAAIIFAGSKLQEEVSPAFERAWQPLQSRAPEPFQYSSASSEQLIRNLQQQGIASVFFVGSGTDALAWIQKAHQASWTPRMFLLGPLVGTEVLDAPVEFQGSMYAAYPALAAPAEGVPEFEGFSQRHHLPQDHRLLQISAYCTAKIFEDVLTRTGRELSRQKLIQSLEHVHNFQTGLLPEITFGPNRRVGYTKTDILCADLKEKRFRMTCAQEQQ